MTDKKKILWLCSWYPSKLEPFNGDFIQRHAIAASLYHNIHVIHVTNDFADDLDMPVNDLRASGNLTEQIIYFKKKKSLFAKYIDHLKWISIYKRAIRNYIIKNGKPDLVHVQVPMKSGILGLWIKKNYKIQYIITEHWGIYNNIINNGYPSMGFAFRKFTKKIFQNAARFISVSNYLAEGVNKLVLSKKHDIVPNAVNTDHFFYKEKDNSIFRFVHVSNMVSLKNVEGILRSFEKHLRQSNHSELILIGEADPTLIDYANELNIPPEKISFLGELPYPQVAVEMQKANCLILFSNIENSPCVIGEALCCGLPVISSDTGGIPELLNTSNSILIKPKDETALSDAMNFMMMNVQQYDSKKIAELASGKFSYATIGSKMNDIYKAVLNQQSL